MGSKPHARGRRHVANYRGEFVVGKHAERRDGMSRGRPERASLLRPSAPHRHALVADALKRVPTDVHRSLPTSSSYTPQRCHLGHTIPQMVSASPITTLAPTERSRAGMEKPLVSLQVYGFDTHTTTRQSPGVGEDIGVTPEVGAGGAPEVGVGFTPGVGVGGAPGVGAGVTFGVGGAPGNDVCDTVGVGVTPGVGVGVILVCVGVFPVLVGSTR
jgi:hypothetical protein